MCSNNDGSIGYVHPSDTTAVPSFITYPAGVCPSCGHCPTCGRRHAAPAYPGYYPWWGINPSPWWYYDPTSITWGGNTYGTSSVASDWVNITVSMGDPNTQGL